MPYQWEESIPLAVSAANPTVRDIKRHAHTSTPTHLVRAKTDFPASARSPLVGFAALTATLPRHPEQRHDGRMGL
jgi:hypothetical protein